MRSRLLCITMLAFAPFVAQAETVDSFEMSENKSGYPCFLAIETSEDTEVTIQLSDYKDIWSINVWVNNRPEKYKTFFTSGFSGPDSEAFYEAYNSIEFGGKSFDLHDATLFEFEVEDIDEKSAGSFELEERHNVGLVLKAMEADGISIPGLLRLSQTTSASKEFRNCAFSAMGLDEEQPISIDYRAEYRQIFEKSFETWIVSMARAEHCLIGRFDDKLLLVTISEAADAFFPGIFNVMKRREYKSDLERKVPLAKLSGMTDAMSEGCMMAAQLAKMSHIPVEQSISAASKLD